MATDMRTLRVLPFVLVACAPVALAQDLRKALTEADVVAVARAVGKTAFSEDVELHRLQLVEPLRGARDGQTTAVVVDWPKLSLHNRPSPRQTRLYCLQDATREAQRIGLPADGGPYYRMSARAGSNPLVGQDLAADPILRFARTLADAERGATPADTANALAAMALGQDAAVRLEATRLFAERPLLRARLSPPQWSDLLGRTSGETADIDYKIALAELCAEQRLDGTVDALLVGLGSVKDPAYARTVGRLCAFLRGEDAAEPLLQRLQTTGDQPTRAALLLAVGATRTAKALDALLQFKQRATEDAAVDAALQEHGSQRAKDAVLRPGKDGKDADNKDAGK